MYNPIDSYEVESVTDCHGSACSKEQIEEEEEEEEEMGLNEIVEFQPEVFQRCYHYSLPSWLKDNDYILSWHRPPTPSFVACFKSIFMIHTETGNIWSHLIGCVLFVTVAYYFFSQPPDIMNSFDKMLFGIFFGSTVICLSFSSAFHIVCCHSYPVIRVFSKLDYCGIAILTIGSFIPWLYYGFYNDFFTKITYLLLVSVMAVSCICVSMSERFRQPGYRVYRYALFAIFGLSGVVPVFHFLLIEGLSKISLIAWLALSGGMYLLGGAIYAARIPERFYPGKFDIWFHSHQIFHVLVIGAAFVHYIGMYEIAFIRLSAHLKNPTEFA